MKELRVNANIYLELKEGESQKEAEERLYNIFRILSESEKGLIIGDFYDSEIQDN